MKKLVFGFGLAFSIIFGLAGCGSESSVSKTSEPDSSFSAKDAIKIEEIDWSVNSYYNDGKDTISFDYTNNSQYVIFDVEMEFTQREDVTAEQLSVFDYLKEERNWTDAEIADIYILGYNRRCAVPGETVSDSHCTLNGSYNSIKSLAEYEVMEPDNVSVAFIADDGFAYVMYYNFKTQTYGESSRGALDINQWSNSELCSSIPKSNFIITVVTTDQQDCFEFKAYGVTTGDFLSYVDSLKEFGFTNINYEGSTSFDAANSDGVAIDFRYTPVEEYAWCSLQTSSES